ncbi:MAG: outer membrane protein assembly factor BamA [Rhizobiaceae bacterium]|nr:outer membrane protein assembly factor BamA [Rhizobiaceae bacterium]
MKFRSRLLSAVSAAALSTGIAISGFGSATIAMTTIAEAASVSRIVVRGNSRVDDGTIINNITITPGQRFDNDDVDDSVKRLFGTGLFSDVRIAVSGGSLVVTVDENQIVNQIIFNGNKKIKDNRLAALVQTQPLGPYNELLLSADIAAIEDAYAGIGREDATVTTQVVSLGDGRVNIAFQVNEGDRTKISSINFVGNNAFSNGRLADVVSTKRSNFLSFLIRKDIYDEDKLRADEELLRRFYYDRGYADFRVISSFAELDETSNQYSITFTVDEGEKYDFGAITVDSTIPNIDAASLQGVIKSRTGNTYSASKVEDTIAAIADEVANQGYPFAQITPRGDRDFSGRTISVDYLVDEGPRAYVERIEIIGNTRTRDYVIRREFDISEGDPFNQVLLRQATKRLNALGYFSNVDISTRQGSEADRVILVVNVTDEPTGEFGIGGGYSNTTGASADISITERNFLGRGQFIKISAGRGEDSQEYELSFTEPYFLGYRLAAGFDVFRKEDTSNSGYTGLNTGTKLRIAAPLTENLTLSANYNYNLQEFSAGGTSTSTPEQAIINQGDRTKSAVGYTVTYKDFDDETLTREGYAVRVSQEFAGLGGDEKFIRTTAKASYFDVVSEASDLIANITVGAGHVAATSGNLSVFEHFYLGGETIRGFDTKGIGPTVNDATTNLAVGGTTYFNASAEVSAPLPAVSRDLGLRFNLFADAATLYGNDIDPTTVTGGQTINGTGMEWRASVGAGITWASPFGPLRVYYAEPIAKEANDKIKKFGFGATSRF